MNTILNAQVNILIVDDTPQNLELLSTLLKEQGFNVRCAINGFLALKVAQSNWADLILLDIKMPGISGYEVCQKLKAEDSTKDIPVIFLSALDDVKDKKQAFAVGAVDYICKPFQIEEVLIRTGNQLAIVRANRQLSQLNEHLEEKVQQRTSELQEINLQLQETILDYQRIQDTLETTNQKLQQEILQRQEIQEKLLNIAFHDALTGLGNRMLFLERLNKVLESSKQNPDYFFAVILLDCDRFKLINDSFGHITGDLVLVDVAKRIEACLKPSGILARLGGDEFGIIIDHFTEPGQLIALAEEIQECMNVPFSIRQREFFCSVSIGIVLGTKKYGKPEHILRDADTAMYRAKSQGRARYRIFDPTMHSQAVFKLQLETDLRIALNNQQLTVYYQPIICLETHSLTGFEALVRWHHPKRGLISPIDFIPIAEDNGLIVPLGLWVMEEACRQLSIWQQEYGAKHLKMAVNLSVKQFAQPNLVEQIDRILKNTELDSSSLKLEITESAIMDHGESVTLLLQELKKRRIQLSIDDFGTGYSSLSYLHRFPVDTLKIDRSFVSRIGDTGENIEIIQVIVNLAHHFQMTLVAEGIETVIQQNYLKNIGCEEGQGYLFSQPVPADKMQTVFEQFYA